MKSRYTLMTAFCQTYHYIDRLSFWIRGKEYGVVDNISTEDNRLSLLDICKKLQLRGQRLLVIIPKNEVYNIEK